jgi:hypothetical protein
VDVWSVPDTPPILARPDRSAVLAKAAALRVEAIAHHETIIELALQGEPDPMEGFVYFIQPTGGGLIKVGYSTNPKSRFRGVQAECPVPLELLGFVPGDRLLEAALHARFSEHRSHNEWFRPAESVRDLLERLRATRMASRATIRGPRSFSPGPDAA